MDFNGFLSFLLVFNGFWLGFTRYNGVWISFTGFYWNWLGFIKFYRPQFGFHWRFTLIYLVLLSFTVFFIQSVLMRCDRVVSVLFVFFKYIFLSQFFYWVFTELLRLMGRGNAPWWTSAGSTPPRATRRNWIFFLFFFFPTLQFFFIDFFFFDLLICVFFLCDASIHHRFFFAPTVLFLFHSDNLSLSLYLASFLFFFGGFFQRVMFPFANHLNKKKRKRKEKKMAAVGAASSAVSRDTRKDTAPDTQPKNILQPKNTEPSALRYKATETPGNTHWNCVKTQ